MPPLPRAVAKSMMKKSLSADVLFRSVMNKRMCSVLGQMPSFDKQLRRQYIPAWRAEPVAGASPKDSGPLTGIIFIRSRGDCGLRASSGFE